MHRQEDVLLYGGEGAGDLRPEFVPKLNWLLATDFMPAYTGPVPFFVRSIHSSSNNSFLVVNARCIILPSAPACAYVTTNDVLRACSSPKYRYRVASGPSRSYCQP